MFWSFTQPYRRSGSSTGSLTTSIAVLLSVEIGAIVLLGAQVIAEYERIAMNRLMPKVTPMQAQKV